MKQILRMAIAIAACALSINATGQKIQLEVIAGPALTATRGDNLQPIEVAKRTINLNAGIGLSYALSEKSFLNVKLLYERKGQKSITPSRDVNNHNMDFKMNVAYDYLTMPVQFRREFGIGKVRFQPGVGVYGAYLMKESVITRVNNHPEFNSTYSSKDNSVPFDFGLSAGVNTYIPLNQSFKLIIGINDNLGLINTAKYSAGVIRHNSLSLTTGISFGL